MPNNSSDLEADSYLMIQSVQLIIHNSNRGSPI